MINPKDFQSKLIGQGYEFFSGVPDSTLKNWISQIELNNKLIHIRAVNECESIGLCAGYYLGTGKPAVSYMQNSGLCKAINPLVSLCDKEVYSIPLLLIIGWRGQEGIKDEPEHIKMGKITLKILETLGINYAVLSDDSKEAFEQLNEATKFLIKKDEPYAIVIRRGTFEACDMGIYKNRYTIVREQAMQKILGYVKKNDLIVSTTGKISRELYEIRENNNKDHSQDFYVIGSMGCASAIGLGLVGNSSRRIFIFDGDGSALMQMGSFASVGNLSPKNLLHILFDNSAYESTGNQKSISGSVDFEKIAKACGYMETKTIYDISEIAEDLFNEKIGPILYVIKVKNCSRQDLGRPKTSPIINKKNFMEFIKNG